MYSFRLSSCIKLSHVFQVEVVHSGCEISSSHFCLKIRGTCSADEPEPLRPMNLDFKFASHPKDIDGKQ